MDNLSGYTGRDQALVLVGYKMVGLLGCECQVVFLASLDFSRLLFVFLSGYRVQFCFDVYLIGYYCLVEL